MKKVKYLDKHKKPIKEGDFCFYSEKPYFDGADYLFEIVNINDSLFAKVVVFISDNGYTKYEDAFPNPLELFIGSRGYMTEITLLKNVNKNMDLIEYMNHQFPLE